MVFINFSNHPSAVWSEEERAAANVFGDGTVERKSYFQFVRFRAYGHIGAYHMEEGEAAI